MYDNPDPPYCSGNVTARSPSSPAFRKTSTGKCCASSHFIRCGLISLSPNSRTIFWICFCSSVRRKSIRMTPVDSLVSRARVDLRSEGQVRRGILVQSPAVKRLAASLVLLFVPTLALAQTPAKPKNGITGFRAELLANLDDTRSKLMELAEAVPAKSYLWRPSKGVRSIGEVYMHVAGSNYYLASFLGRTPPADAPQDIEKIKDKQRELAELRKSFDYIRGVIESERDQDLDKPVKMFGNQTTRRGVLLTVITHVHEHLGQSIAYARMNGVVPPWSGR